MKSLKIVKAMMALIVAGIIFVASPAHALRSFVANITEIETTYLPGLIKFSLSTGPGCATGGYTWDRGAENNKLTYAGMLAAMLSGKSVVVFFGDSDSCAALFFYVRNQ